jgi:hypothetical protein
VAGIDEVIIVLQNGLVDEFAWSVAMEKAIGILAKHKEPSK